DTRDFEGMAQVFCKDAVFDCTEGFGVVPVGGTFKGVVGPVTKGRDAIIEWVSGYFADWTSMHHGHCHEVTVDSETEAHGVMAMEDSRRTLDRETETMRGYGHYHEKYRFEEGAWRIAEVKLPRLFMDSTPQAKWGTID